MILLVNLGPHIFGRVIPVSRGKANSGPPSFQGKSYAHDKMIHVPIDRSDFFNQNRLSKFSVHVRPIAVASKRHRPPAQAGRRLGNRVF